MHLTEGYPLSMTEVEGHVTQRQRGLSTRSHRQIPTREGMSNMFVHLLEMPTS